MSFARMRVEVADQVKQALKAGPQTVSDLCGVLPYERKQVANCLHWLGVKNEVERTGEVTASGRGKPHTLYALSGTTRGGRYKLPEFDPPAGVRKEQVEAFRLKMKTEQGRVRALDLLLSQQSTLDAPEKKLWLQAIMQAVRDLNLAAHRAMDTHPSDTRAFFVDGRLDTICSLLDLEPEYLRDCMRQLKLAPFAGGRS